MATDQRARDLGFKTPGPNDLIRDGDDAISQNARAAVDLFDRTIVTYDNLSGTATTLPAGSPATVIVTGTLPNKVINVGIPKGEPGMGYEEGQQLVAAAAQSASDAQTALQAPFMTQDEGVAALIETAAGPLTKGALQAREPHVLVTDYGAVGDLATDDTAALQAAIDALPTNGGDVALPSGRWKITAPLKLRGGVKIVGTGRRSSRIIVAADCPAFHNETPTSRKDNVTLANLRVERSITSTTPLIDLTGITYATMTNLTVAQTGSTRAPVGVQLGNQTYYAVIEAAQVSGCDVGIDLTNGANGNRLIGTTVIQSGIGYRISESNANFLSSASAENCDSYGVLLRQDAHGNVITGCRAESTGIGYAVEQQVATAAIGNFFLGNYASAVAQEHSVPYSNIVLSMDKKHVLDMAAAQFRTFVRAQLSSAQSVPAGTWTNVPYDQSPNDQLGEFAGGIVTVTTPGYYTFTAGVGLSAVSPGATAEAAVYVNGSMRNHLGTSTTSDANTRLSGTVLLDLSAGDQVTVRVRSSVVSAVQSGGQITYLHVTRLP